jgi:hypothetical protein
MLEGIWELLAHDWKNSLLVDEVLHPIYWKRSLLGNEV